MSQQSTPTSDEKLYYVDIVALEELEAAKAHELEEDELECHFPDQELLEYPEVSGDFNLELDYFDAAKQEEMLWQARTGLNHETLPAAVETIIFMSDRPIALQKIRKMIDEDMPLRVIHEAIEKLQQEYESKHHGIRLMEVAEGYQFRTKATYSKYVQDLFNVNSLVLTPTALEVLAVIAYKQPVAKTEVDKIRGVDSSHIVRGLMDKRLVRVVGRSEELGRPVLYGTTQEFMEVFNLASLDELPPEHELEEMASESIGKVSDIKGLVHAGDKKRFIFDEMDELESLADSIKAISADTEFTKSVKVEEKKRVSEAGEAVKSAFDLLEEYIDREQISKANQDSLGSELFTAVTDPLVIDDLTAGPFNVPEDEGEEEFEMIDLETGQPIRDDEQEDEQDCDISQALDAAFDRLENPSFEEVQEDLEDSHRSFDERSEQLGQWSKDVASQARDFDIDLDFLRENSDLDDGESSKNDSSHES